MQTLFIVNDAPYGSERSDNALRLARALSQEADQSVRVFQLGEAVLGGTCMDARGIVDEELVAGARRGTLKLLAGWPADADKVLVF